MRSDGAVRGIRFWRRFDVRTTLLFGVPVIALSSLLSFATYRITAGDELKVLQQRIRGLAVGLSRTIDPATLRSLRRAEDHGTPIHRGLQRHFASVAADEPEVISIYVLRRTARDGWLRFACDWVRPGSPHDAAHVAQLYDATRADRMLAAFARPEVESEIYQDEWGRNLSGYAPIRDPAGGVLAIVGVDISARRLEEIRSRALRTALLMNGVAIVFFAICGVLLGRSIRRPIQNIIEATQAIAAGEPHVRTGLSRADELGLLAARVDRMAGELEERERMRAIFGRYVSEDVARRVLESEDAAPHGAREREVTALFADIRRYSTISETLSPHDVVELLNAYFAGMIGVVDEHRGCVIELLGDGILAVFGAPEELEDHPACAVRCARAMQARLEELNDEWEASGLAALWKQRGVDRIRARIGVHTGSAVAGTLGTQSRTKYTVLGRAVNVAFGLEALNEQLGTSVLVSGETLARLDEELAGRAEDRGEHEARGAKVRVYSV